MMLVGRVGGMLCGEVASMWEGFSTGKKNDLPATQYSSGNSSHYIYYICISFIQALDILYMPSVEYLLGGASLGSNLGGGDVESRGADNTTHHTTEAKGDYTSKKEPSSHFLPSPSTVIPFSPHMKYN